MACRAATGLSPTELAAERGVLGPSTVAVHATHVTAGDVALLGQTRDAVCLCPTTERDLGDGVGPAAALRDAGCPLRLGTDSHAVVDLFEEARAVELDERLVVAAAWHPLAGRPRWRRRPVARPCAPVHRPTCASSTSTASGSPASTRTSRCRWSSPPHRRPT